MSILAATAAGCVAPPRAQQERLNPSTPSWDERAFAEHLRVLNGREEVGRDLGSPGYGFMAEYVKDRMREFMLQPALEGRYTVATPRRYATVQAFSATLVRPDTLRLIPGLDVLPDGRTDSADLTAEVVTIVGGDSVLSGEFRDVVVLTAEEASLGRLRALRRQGVRLVLLVGPLRAPVAAQRIPGLGVVWMSYQAAVQVLDMPGTRLRSALRPAAPHEVHLPVPLRVEIDVAEVEYDRYSVMGYVAGRHPTRARELVLVCADLEALVPVPDLQVVDFGAFGRSTAALLETARVLSRSARFSDVPERSLLFAVWLDAGEDPDELQSYLRAPLWALEQTRTVIYVGLEEERVAEVEAMLAPHGIALHVVPPPSEMLHTPETMLVPQGPMRREAQRQERAVPDLGEVDLDMLVRRGATQALHMAAELYDLVLREAVVTPAAGPTVEQDSVAVP